MADDDNDSPSVAAAAAGGDELALLRALRTRLAEAVDDCPVRDLSSLTRRLQDVNKEIREMEEVRKKEAGDGSGSSGTGGAGWNPTDDL